MPLIGLRPLGPAITPQLLLTPSSLFPAGFLPNVPAARDGKYRLLFVHAHPDDESIVTGATMSHFARLGAEVSLLTSTRGELGEVVPAELKHLEQGLPAATDDGGTGLARVREAELQDAVAALGIQQHFFLGQPLALAPGEAATLYRDSGMSWGSDGRAQAAEKVLPASFSRAPLEEVARHAAALIRALRPDVVVTYASDGGYGHPDHIRTHQMTVAALDLAANGGDSQHPAWDVPLSYSILSDRPERPHHRGAEVLWINGDLAAKREAMRAHHTQIVVDEDRFALSDLSFQPLTAREGFQVLRKSQKQASIVSARHAGPRQRSVSDWIGYSITAVLAGVLVAVLGTMLHSRNSALGNWSFPWGALLALLLLGSTITLVRAWSRSVALGLLVGLITYVTCVIFSIPHGPAALILADLEGILWLYGIAVVTLGFMVQSVISAGSRKSGA